MITETTLIAGIIGAAGSTIALIIKSLFSRNQNRKDQQEHEENLLKIGATMNNVNQEISELRKTFNDCFIEISNNMDKLDKKLESFHSEQKTINISLLRHNITDVYEQFKDQKEIPNIVYESTMSLYDNYKKCGGNSFIDNEIQEMKQWRKF